MLVTIVFIVSMATPVMATGNVEASMTNVTVGVLTLFSSTGSSSSSVGSGLGHAFLSFKNTTNSIKMVGVYGVAPQEEITFGKWGNTGNYGHVGIWYNLESYLDNNKDAFADRISISIAITQSELNRINEIMENGDSYQLYGDNCVDFGVEIWYETSSIYVLSTGYSETSASPSYALALMNAIETTGESQTGRTIAFNSNVGYAQNGMFCEVDPLTLTRIAIFLDIDNEDIQSMSEGGV